MALAMGLALCAGVLAPPASALADMVPLAVDPLRQEHLDTCNPEPSNIYMGPLHTGQVAFHGFNDGLISSKYWLCEAEIIIVGAQAVNATPHYPAHTTPKGWYWTSGRSAGGIDFSYAYTAWTQKDTPAETGWTHFSVSNSSGYDSYYSVAITEGLYPSVSDAVNPPGPLLPGWFDVDAIVVNALPPPLGPPNPELGCHVAMAGGTLLINAGISGDFDGDGDVDADDIDLLADAIRLGLINPMYDLSGAGEDGTPDGFIDLNDLDYLVHQLVETTIGVGSEYGDFNLDGIIDTTDLTRLATYYGPGDTWAKGNANRNIDLITDTTDLTILATYYGFGVPDVVPEPATLSLLALGACLPLLRKRR